VSGTSVTIDEPTGSKYFSSRVRKKRLIAEQRRDIPRTVPDYLAAR